MCLGVHQITPFRGLGGLIGGKETISNRRLNEVDIVGECLTYMYLIVGLDNVDDMQ